MATTVYIDGQQHQTHVSLAVLGLTFIMLGVSVVLAGTSMAGGLYRIEGTNCRAASVARSEYTSQDVLEAV